MTGVQTCALPISGKRPFVGLAFLWRQFNIESAPMTACVMVTVPANKLIATLDTDRMPAVLDDADWDAWLGERGTAIDNVKACLKTDPGKDWTMAKEELPPRAKTKVRA